MQPEAIVEPKLAPARVFAPASSDRRSHDPIARRVADLWAGVSALLLCVVGATAWSLARVGHKSLQRR